jgi:hypothetical protein
MESTSESPKKRGEPVFGSRIWLLIATISACAWFAFTLYVKVPQIPEAEDWLEAVLWLAGEIIVQLVLILMLIHALRSVWRSGERRSFDLMAIAIGAQRPFILGFALLAATGTVFFSVWAHQTRMFNTGVKQFTEGRKPAAPSPQKPAQP